jgi:LuxR family transcriptional regulator, maltose regulon positive regulatory protein
MTDRHENVSVRLRSPRFPSSKFSAPRSVSQLVHRPRLLDELDRGQWARLTLVVGSPGAGKTALLADWVATRLERPLAWLSCDSADADPVRFFAAIIETLRRASAQPEIGEDARQLLSLDGEVSADVIAALAGDLERPDDALVLVVDDLHLTGAAGADALALLLDYRPSTLQVVAATRVDPPLRLRRMPANEELVELRDRDLSFSAEETTAFLAGFGVRLSAQDLATVHGRSEGWAAGLQMAAISIQNSPDPASAAGRVALDRHSVAGYFLDEVLYRQPPEVVDFMLATSVLDELSVPACTVLCGQGSAALLQLVYSSHMFVTVLDDEARTYRYHQLVKEVLQAELHSRDPERERRLHEAAARHLGESHQIGLAARHLVAAGDPAAAFLLLSQGVVRDVLTHPTLGSALDMAEVEPDVFAGAPEILVPLAAELLWRGAFERGSRAFALAQQTAVDPGKQPELAVKLATVRTLHCTFIGQFEEALAHRRWARSFEVKAAGVEDWVVALDTLAMYSHVHMGEFTEARQLADAVASVQFSPPLTQVLIPGTISRAALIEGDLEEARALASSTLDAARRLGFDRHYFAFHTLRTLALLALERCDYVAAAEPIERALGMVGGARPVFSYLAQLDRARIWAADGHVDEALASLPAARTALRSDRSVVLAQADELEARFRFALGDQRGALSVAEGLPGDRRMVVSAIIALGAGDPEGAAQALSDAPVRGTTTRTDLELRLLRASVAIMRSSDQAPQLVRQALEIADRQGFAQTVLDTAPRLVDYLVSHSTTYSSTENLRALIAAGMQVPKLAPSRRDSGRLPDPLTEAEVRVLEKLPQRLTYVEMASDLNLSLNTVKTHLRHAYMKLGVTSRDTAIKRAASLGLL